MNKVVIITGGPGSGKTTLINELDRLGYKTYPEISRQIIEDNLRTGGQLLPWIDLKSFADACYSKMLSQKNEAVAFPSFVDRAIGDIIAYSNRGQIEGSSYSSGAFEGYFPHVFLIKPTEDIYVRDEVRPHSFDEALEIHGEIEKVYRTLGFEVIELPPLNLSDQLNKIFQVLEIKCHHT